MLRNARPLGKPQLVLVGWCKQMTSWLSLMRDRGVTDLHSDRPEPGSSSELRELGQLTAYDGRSRSSWGTVEL